MVLAPLPFAVITAIAVMVVLWESGLLVNMGMTNSGNQNIGTTNKQTQVSIENDAHILAATLTGN